MSGAEFLFSEQFGVRAKADKAQRLIVRLLINQEKVGFQVAFPVPLLFSGEFMILISRQNKNIFQQCIQHNAMSFVSPSHVSLELA